MAEFAPLFPLETQFQAKDGRNNTAGWLKVFLAGTDDPAVTYSDYSGTRNPEKIVLDNNGRAVIICDKEVGYRLEVYDARGMLLWTEEPVFCSGTGGAGMAITEVVSTDGSIDVQKNTAGGIIQYDIGLAPGDSPEFLEWSTVYKNNLTSGESVVPVYQAGTMSVDEYGVKVYADRFYHITNRFMVKPKGTGLNYDTFEVSVMFRRSNGNASNITYDKQNIDSSLSDSVDVEFSFDFQPTEDGELYWLFNSSCLAKFNGVDATMQVHRIYSGINAVPDTCATKQWVSANYQHQSAMSRYVPYSAIGHDGDGAISGINGSAIAGQGVSPVTYVTTANTVYDVSHILASGGNPVFVDSLGVDKGLYVLVENWDTENGFKSFGRIENNGLYSYATFWNVNVDGWETTSYIISDVQADWSEIASNSPAYIKNKPDLNQYQTTAGMSGYLQNSASGSFYPMTGNPSGFLTAHQDISNKLDSTAFTAYTSTALTSIQNDITSISASVSAVTGLTGTYLEQSSFDQYSADIDSALDDKADGSALTAYIPFSSLDYSGSAISGIGGSSLAGIGQGAGDYSGIYPVLVDNVNRTISVDDTGIAVDETMTAYESGGELVIGVASGTLAGKLDTSAFTGYTATALTGLEQDVSSLSATVSGLTGTYLEQSASALFAPSSVETSKLDASASSQFITSTAGLQPSGDYAYNSALSGKLDESAFSAVSGTFLTAVPAGYATETYVDSAVSGKADSSALDDKLDKTAQVVTATATGNYTMGGFITTGVSGINGKPLLAVSAGSAQCDSLGHTITATYQTTAGMSSYQPSGDYAYNSAVSGKADTSALTAYQEVSGMTAYQPAGTYIYESALGWAEV